MGRVAAPRQGKSIEALEEEEGKRRKEAAVIWRIRWRAFDHRSAGSTEPRGPGASWRAAMKRYVGWLLIAISFHQPGVVLRLAKHKHGKPGAVRRDRALRPPLIALLGRCARFSNSAICFICRRPTARTRVPSHACKFVVLCLWLLNLRPYPANLDIY